jgi:hypothetical protein
VVQPRLRTGKDPLGGGRGPQRCGGAPAAARTPPWCPHRVVLRRQVTSLGRFLGQVRLHQRTHAALLAPLGLTGGDNGRGAQLSCQRAQPAGRGARPRHAQGAARLAPGPGAVPEDGRSAACAWARACLVQRPRCWSRAACWADTCKPSSWVHACRSAASRSERSSWERRSSWGHGSGHRLPNVWGRRAGTLNARRCWQMAGPCFFVLHHTRLDSLSRLQFGLQLPVRVARARLLLLTRFQMLQRRQEYVTQDRHPHIII